MCAFVVIDESFQQFFARGLKLGQILFDYSPHEAVGNGFISMNQHISKSDYSLTIRDLSEKCKI